MSVGKARSCKKLKSSLSCEFTITLIGCICMSNIPSATHYSPSNERVQAKNLNKSSSSFVSSDPIIERLSKQHSLNIEPLLSGVETQEQVDNLNLKRGYFLKYSKHYRREQVKDANKAFDEDYGGSESPASSTGALSNTESSMASSVKGLSIETASFFLITKEELMHVETPPSNKSESTKSSKSNSLKSSLKASRNNTGLNSKNYTETGRLRRVSFSATDNNSTNGVSDHTANAKTFSIHSDPMWVLSLDRHFENTNPRNRKVSFSSSESKLASGPDSRYIPQNADIDPSEVEQESDRQRKVSFNDDLLEPSSIPLQFSPVLEGCALNIISDFELPRFTGSSLELDSPAAKRSRFSRTKSKDKVPSYVDLNKTVVSLPTSSVCSSKSLETGSTKSERRKLFAESTLSKLKLSLGSLFGIKPRSEDSIHLWTERMVKQ